MHRAMGVSEARRLGQPEEEDRELKQVLTEAVLENHALDGSDSSSQGSPARTHTSRAATGSAETSASMSAGSRRWRMRKTGTGARWWAYNTASPQCLRNLQASRIRAAKHSNHTVGILITLGAGHEISARSRK